ncbi:MAG: NUDIX hydrolase [Bacteroidota bacterium]
MENIIKTAGVLICLNNKVLLVRHGEKAGHLNDTYGIPAGRIELGEKSIDAAVRELFEETGLITSIEYLEKVPETYTAAIARKDGVKTFSQENFLCKHWDGELKANNETIPEWITITEIDKLKLLPNVKKMVSDALPLK